MSAKAISEQTGKELLYKYICTTSAIQNRFKYARVTPDTDWAHLLQDHPWLLSQSLVVKPDQLIKRRGKLGLVGVNLSLDGVKSWLKPRLGHEATVGKAKGFLKNFLIEPFVPHSQAEEFYVCIYATREGDYVLFHHEGGVDVGDVDTKAQKLLVGVDEKLNAEDIKRHLLVHAPEDKKEILASFISGLFNFYEDLYFTYLEINPLVVTKDGVYILDLAAKVDATADYICKVKWGDIEFPPPFGREAYPEEAYIADLDAKSGASLKLTLLNPKGRIWTMVAGGGASVVYSDTICDLGGVNELANYGEYSGAPSEQQTYDYAKTILSLMTREKHPDGKILIIGGSIANFTNVAATFKGIVRAIRDYQGPLKEHEVTIFVRRGGPNYQEGLRVMGEVGKTTGIPIHVFGTETHMTAIVGMALGHRPIPNQPPTAAHTANFLLNASGSTSTPAPSRTASFSESRADEVAPAKKAKPAMPQDSVPSPRSLQGKSATLFSRHTKAIVWGMQTRAVQGMLDFDYVCSRDEPSVAAMVYPFTGDHKQKFYWGHKEILIPVFKNMADAMKKHPEVDVLINFASLRSAYDSTMETMNYAQIRTIAIIAEGIPEALTRKLIKKADQKGVTIIGPATVGGIKPGCFKIGNTGGMLDNILASKLYRPGSVAYVSRSGGMSNELNNIISRTTDGVYEGVAIGGDRYPGSTFMDHVLRYQDTPGVKMIVVLGEIGGTEEYKICRGIKEGRLTKPVVCWCIGTCATMFSSEVQFGHAGACANQASETAVAKNQALKEAGVFVPRSFDELGEIIQSVYEDLVAKGAIVPAQEVPPPTVPMDYSWARSCRTVRKLRGRYGSVKMAAAVAAAAAAAAAAASFQVLEMESMETAVAGSASLAAEVRGSGTVDFVTGAGISTLVDTGGGDPGPEAEDFECSTHCSELSWRQNEQRRQGLFCDITLCFGGAGGREFRAHRSVLAAATEYFTPLLSGQFSESRSGRVEMRKWSSEPGPEPDTVEAVIEYMYTGRIRVSTGSVHEVLELADRFLLIRLKEFCGEFLKKKLHLSNCVAIHSLAHMYTLSQLALKAADMIRRNFYKVIQDEEFYTLPFHLIRDWLSDLEITVDSEEVLFETVLKWVQRNAEERERYFEELFKLLRLSQMKPTYLTRHVKPERLVANNEVCVKLVAEAVERHALRAENIQSGTLQHPTSQVSLLPRYGQNMDVIMVIGGVSEGGDYLSECVGYFVDEDRWVNLPHIHNHLDGHAVAITESYVYVAGSMEPGFAKTVERYNPNLNTWEHVCSLMTRKHSFGLTEVKGKLYSIGGHGNFSPGFKDVTVYNPELDKWHNLESAPKILRDVKALAVEDRFVYIAARTPVDRDTEDGLKAVITCYDTETRQWQDVESLPLIDNYCFFQMSVVNSNFYQTASCCPKSYSLENEEAVRKIAGQVSDEILESLPPEVLSIEGAAICYYRDDVFIIGGWKNSDDIDKQYRKEAYRYCAERKRWMLLPPMPQPRCRATACHVRIPYRYLHGTQRYPMPQNLMWQKDRIRQMQEIHRHALNMRRVPSSQIEC